MCVIRAAQSLRFAPRPFLGPLLVHLDDESLYTIYVRFNVPPLFIVPPPIGREHVPRGSVPPSRLTGGWYPTEVARRAEARRRGVHADTSAGAKRVQSAQLLSRPVLVARHSTSKRAHAGSPLRAPGGARRKRVVELRRVHALHEPAPEAERGGSPLLGRLGPGTRPVLRSYASRNTDTNTRDTATVPPSWEHADVPPSLKCTPLLRLYPLPWSRSTIGYIKTHIDGIRRVLSPGSLLCSAGCVTGPLVWCPPCL